jgi:hypothetical protein
MLGSPCPDHNPLRRGVDRAESRLIAALIVFFLLGAPLVALAAFQARWHGAAVAARQEKADWRQVPAVLLRGVPPLPSNVYGPIQLTPIPARWKAPDGTAQSGTVMADFGTRAGGTVTIWTSQSGRQTGPPLTRSQIVGQAMVAAALTVTAQALLLIVSALIIRQILNRRRMAAWDAEWTTTGPRWSRWC